MFTTATSQAMSLYGAFSALLMLGIFVGTWWFYGIRGPAEALALSVERARR